MSDRNLLSINIVFINFSGPGFGGLSKVFVARHSPSKTLVVVKQTNVDVQKAEQLEELKVWAYFINFNVFSYNCITTLSIFKNNCGIILLLFHQCTLDMRWYIAKEAHSTELAIIITYPTRASGIIVLLKSAHKIIIENSSQLYLQKQPIFFLILILSRRIQLPYLESVV